MDIMSGMTACRLTAVIYERRMFVALTPKRKSCQKDLEQRPTQESG
jgi:hypothetical protein